ncbi:Hypothetical predicted protein [Marmota monax]|uniref:sn-1-specific diacylglycerol lipase ABHD11 n=1 Tax=Marmota monax TaxID=9995 RepID=A0A5E4AH37_MARMO|nr:Hypothetical predicted protein [Marmota monax]
MLCWARSCRLPRGALGPSTPSFSRVPVIRSSSNGQREGKRRPLPLSYRLLDGETTLPAIVLLHGLFGSKTNFNSIAKALAQQTGRRVLTVDARNHGDSPHSPDVSYEAMCQDLQSLLPQLDLAPCALIGHSMGGKTAMLLALQRVSRPCLGLPPSNLDLRCPAGDLGLISLRGPSLGSRNWACSETGPQSNYLPQPELVERLIAVDISPVKTTGTSKFATYVAAMKSIDIPDKMPRSQARKLADKQLSHAVQDMAMRQFLLTNLVEVDGHFQWRVNLDALAEHLDEIMNFPPQQEPYSGPTLFLLGGSSHYVCPSHHPEIRRLFPGARIQTVPNANHWVHADRPQDFMAAVQSFLV